MKSLSLHQISGITLTRIAHAHVSAEHVQSPTRVFIRSLNTSLACDITTPVKPAVARGFNLSHLPTDAAAALAAEGFTRPSLCAGDAGTSCPRALSTSCAVATYRETGETGVRAGRDV